LEGLHQRRNAAAKVRILFLFGLFVSVYRESFLLLLLLLLLVVACLTMLRICIRYGADVDCQTDSKYTPLHRCAFYNHSRLASLLLLAGANQKLKDKDGRTAYDVAVKEQNPELVKLLQPLITKTGEDITGIAYATNNPKHPNFRPEAREALFNLYSFESKLASAGKKQKPATDTDSSSDDNDANDDDSDASGSEEKEEEKKTTTTTAASGDDSDKKDKKKEATSTTEKKRTRNEDQSSDQTADKQTTKKQSKTSSDE